MENNTKSKSVKKTGAVQTDAQMHEEKMEEASKDNTLTETSTLSERVGSLLTEASKVGKSYVLPILNPLAMPGWLGEVVLHACESTELHPVFVLAELLSFFGAQIFGPYVMHGGVKISCSTNMAIIGNSPKSWKATLSGVVEKIFSGILGCAQHIEGNMQNGESLIDAVSDTVIDTFNDTGTGTNSPTGKNTKNQDRDRRPNEKRLLFREKEIRNAFSYAKRIGSALTATVSGFFEKGSAKSNKKSATDAHVSIIAHTRCADHSALLNDARLSDDFASYFIWLLVDRAKVVPNPKSLPEEFLLKYRALIADLIEAANELGELKMTKRAKKLWNDLYPGFTKVVPGVAGSIISRSEIHMLKLAQSYALAAKHKWIMVADIQAAHALMQYSWESVDMIFKTYGYCENDTGKIISALYEAPNQELSRTEINRLFNGNTSSANIVEAWRELEKQGLVEVLEEESKKGRKTTTIRLIPK